MRREIQKQNNFKQELRFILAAFLLPFCAILALGLLCLGRELMKDSDAEPSSSISWPLAAVDTATSSLPEAAGEPERSVGRQRDADGADRRRGANHDAGRLSLGRGGGGDAGGL